MTYRAIVITVASLMLLVGARASLGPALAADKPGEARGLGPAGVSAGQVVDRDYFAAGPLVEMSGTINGDLYAAGGQVLVDGQVNGDVLVAGGRVLLSGAVVQSIRVARPGDR
jgi:hypothetical protein